MIGSGKFATVQVPYNILNPSAGQDVADEFVEVDYGNVIADCARQQMGVLAIRVYAGGALASQPPSPHTYQTKFFPLGLVRAGPAACRATDSAVGSGGRLEGGSAKICLKPHPQISGAIVGFADPQHVRDALNYLAAGPLSAALIAAVAGE